ncbi:acetyl-CoA carboxylase biotin carboxyl carrier protein subunit [Pedobacter sp. AW1-32]|uniref:acetyl-CoA carboxylase biotin carboxyl carrier protein subunit n=1 Tax=Pedobacter sp. AW1-32 TaxID=3383026 RepID=UPI003FEE5C1D
MYKINVNGQFHFEVEHKNGEVKLGEKVLSLDVLDLPNDRASILYENRSYNTELVEINRQEKTCKLKVNGNVYDLKVEDNFDQLLKQLGMDNLSSVKISEVKAPMPGLVLRVLVEEGTEVKKGDSLVVLEAMKMENILKSATDGTVKKILIKEGNKVEKNQIMIQFS